MSYFLDLFSPETYEAFARTDRTVSGFRRRHHGIAGRVKPGDRFLCYMTKVSRWFGILDVLEGPYIDETPIHSAGRDRFVVRFRVKPAVWLPVAKGVPIHEDQVWNALSFTRGQSKSSSTWTGKLRGSLVQFSDEDGKFLESLITAQLSNGVTYHIDESEYRRLLGHRVRRADKDVSVIVPDDSIAPAPEVSRAPEEEVRESIKIQALLAEAGSRMGLQIWIPRSDRGPSSENGGAIIRRSSNGYPSTTTIRR